MNAPESPDAIRKRVNVRCGVETAFRIWTEQIDAWWPKGHSRSGNPQTSVFVEHEVGGRIFERTPDGVEHDWGEVTLWEPPNRFAYRWYLGSSPERPTLVEVRFAAQERGGTLVEVSHRGPELVGEIWTRNSTRYSAAWESVLPAYIAACNIGE